MTPSFLRVAEQFAKLPGIGLKTAQRLAYHILTMPPGDVRTFAETIIAARNSVRVCAVCQNFTEIETEETCPVCMSAERNKSIICVVESPKDVTAIERGRNYNGTYHVLHGLLSPMNNISPADIKIKELLSRLSADINEIIMATNPTVEGEATAVYIGKLVKPLGIKTSRLAYGLPVGASLEFADDVTLARAIENRTAI